jgi:hypothetical protein
LRKEQETIEEEQNELGGSTNKEEAEIAIAIA